MIIALEGIFFPLPDGRNSIRKLLWEAMRENGRYSTNFNYAKNINKGKT